MKILKNSIFGAFAALALVGCGSTTAPIVSTPIQNIDTLPYKIAPLTDAQYKVWPYMDLVNDTVPGMSVDKAYAEIIKNRKGEKVIVAVLDSGVDIDHEDLKNVIWTNKDEIANNGKDDDNNGFIDDVHGWNFLGNITDETLEYVRYIKKLNPKFEGKSEASISAADRADYAIYKKAKAEYDKEVGETKQNLARYSQMYPAIEAAHKTMVVKTGKADYTVEDLNAIKDPSAKEKQEIGMLSQMLSSGAPVSETLKQIKGGIDYFQNRMDTNFNLERDFRAENLGDNADDFSTKIYGNNQVGGPEKDKASAKHGTHVSGIIAAQRNNGIGMNGVANNVMIMPVRAVSNGDEYDKDIALGIRYAVDNGAKVINTSFGKYYSPHADWVWDAIKYAASKDVLIVNAAGNEGINLDQVQVYPNDQTTENTTEIADNFLTVGALSYTYGGEVVAGFSNYGKANIDVLAPGVKIWATTPMNTYEFLQGTSMASPETAGVAAVIRSYYPKLTAPQVKKIIMDSGLSSNGIVVLGGDKSNTDKFGNISKSGNMVNLYNALIMADKMSR